MGPRVDQKKEAEDLWSQALALKMLLSYFDATGDARAPVCIEKTLRMLSRHIEDHPLAQWGNCRWYEFLISIWWLYERKEDSWLLDLARKIQKQGFVWKEYFKDWPQTKPTKKGNWNLLSHVVNNAMAIKEGALWWRLSGAEEDRQAPQMMMDALDRCHGMPSGVFTGDECLAGVSVVQGTELCAVVEYMYSLEWLISLLGQAAFADRLEQIAFNALPATFTPDMWAHQYVQQVNQVECSICSDRNWTTNGPDANLYGLEPHFGCCTSNFSQGWPKFTSHLWMRTQNGIAAVAYAPSRLETEVAGVSVCIELETGYPFRETIECRVTVEEPVSFPLLLRIPVWAHDAVIEIDSKTLQANSAGAFQEIKRLWEGEITVRLTLPMKAKLVPRPNHAVSIERGPLLYAMPVGESWKRVNQDLPCRELPHADWEVYASTPWNYALCLAGENELDDLCFTEGSLDPPVFAPETPPVKMSIRGCRIAEWKQQHGAAQETPRSPVKINASPEEITLIPYGCTNLRIAEFPVTDDQRCAPAGD